MIQHIKQKIKQNNGFTGQDILIALFILMLFLSAFTTIMVNLSSTSKEIDDVKKITEKITKIADKVDAMKIEDIENKVEDEEITNLIGDEGNIGSDRLKVFYQAEGTDEYKTVTLKVKRLNSKGDIPEDNVFEMRLSKQAVTIESDTGEGDGNGDGSEDGSGTGTETKPIESVEHIGVTEKTEKKAITTRRVRFINTMNATEGTYTVQANDVSIIWSNKENQTVSTVGGGGSYTYWVALQVNKEGDRFVIKDIVNCGIEHKNMPVNPNTIVIMLYQEKVPEGVNIGDYIEFSPDAFYTKYTSAGSKNGYGDFTIYRDITTTTTAPPKTLYKTSEHTINAINVFDGAGRPTIYYSKSNQTVGNILGTNTSTFGAWYGYKMKKENEHYYVEKIYESNENKRECQLKQDEFMLLFHKDYTGRPTLKVGDCVQLNFDYTTISSGTNGNGYGKVSIFNTEIKPEEEKPKPEGPKDEIVVNTNAQYPYNRPVKTSEVHDKGYEFGTGKYLTPIKFVWTNVTATSKEGYWVKTTEDDIEWYSLEENIWPTFAYSTASFKNPGSVTGYTKGNGLQPLKSNPFTGLRFSKVNADDKYIFIWLPRMIRNLNTELETNKAAYFWAYEKTNKKIQLSQEGYSNMGGSQQEYSGNLYSDNLNTVYARGTIIGWYKDKKENNGWDELLNLIGTKHMYNVNLKLEQQIRNINKHEGDQPR